MASLATRLVRLRVNGVACEVIAPVDEVFVHVLWALLRGCHRLAGVTVRTKTLLVANRAGSARRPGDGRMNGGEVSLMAKEADRLEWMTVQVDVTHTALTVLKLLLVVVAAETGTHR